VKDNNMLCTYVRQRKFFFNERWKKFPGNCVSECIWDTWLPSVKSQLYSLKSNGIFKAIHFCQPQHHQNTVVPPSVLSIIILFSVIIHYIPTQLAADCFIIAGNQKQAIRIDLGLSFRVLSKL